LKIKIRNVDGIIPKNKECLYKIKSKFNYYLNKIPKFEKELDKFKNIYDNLNTKLCLTNAESNISLDEEKIVFECLKDINTIFSMTKEPYEEPSSLNQSLNDCSVIYLIKPLLVPFEHS